MSIFSRLALLSLICAMISVAVEVTYASDPLLFRIAASLGVLAFLLILLDNYASSAALPMRSGLLDKKKAPLRYRLVYLFLVLMGLVFLLVTWTT